jgi:ArsR family transcriptional regulator, lead/cadmium/zinc/bismuth-responsive transcriptional repressor
LEPALRDDLAATFRQLSDPNRLGIALLCLERERSVGEMAETLGLSLSLVSAHLRRLKDARLVRSRRQGKQVLCRLDDAHVAQMLRVMVEHVAHPGGCAPEPVDRPED